MSTSPCPDSTENVNWADVTAPLQSMLYHHSPYMLSKKKISMAFRRTGDGAFLTFAGCLLAVSVCGMLIPTMMQDIAKRELPNNSSLWVWRGSRNYVMTHVRKVNPFFREEILASKFDPNFSWFLLKPGEDRSTVVYTESKPVGKDVKFKEVAFYDPKNQLKEFQKTDFSRCEYKKCKVATKIDLADAVVFEASRLNMSTKPAFKRKPGQIWVFSTSDAPSKNMFFSSFNTTGVRDAFNWTMVFRNKSDIQNLYGFLKPKPVEMEPKDYGTMFEEKTKTAAWFVTKCPTRSRRQQFVNRMKTRMDIDVYGECGTLQCATAKRDFGIMNARVMRDNSSCFPLLSSKYKFYFAFESSLCKDYVTEDFFKIFGPVPVDVVPVVRGGTNYRKFFPPDMYVDASDFRTPEDLADYLVDLSNDKERYIRMLKAKDRWQSVGGFPSWQCSLCKKLHLEGTKKHQYKNIVEWFTKNQCFDDAADGAKLY